MSASIVLLALASCAVASANECINVPSNMTLCHGLLHPHSALPNWNDDKTLVELMNSNSDWGFIVNAVRSCHAFLQHFVCSVLTPVCIRQQLPMETRKIVPACRSFCEQVRDSCADAFLYNLSIPWPLNFRCSRFPSYSSACYTPIGLTTSTPKRTKKPCQFCASKPREASLLTYYCVASMVVVGRVQNGKVFPRSRNITATVLYGRDLAQRLFNNKYWNVSGACPCRKSVTNVTALKSGGKCKMSAMHLVFIDNYDDELTASLVVRLDSLSRHQRKEWREIKGRKVECSKVSADMQHTKPRNQQRKRTTTVTALTKKITTRRQRQRMD